MELRVRETGREAVEVREVRPDEYQQVTLDSCSPVGSVSCAKGIVDINISQFGQRRPEGIDLLLRGLSLKQRTREIKRDT